MNREVSLHLEPTGRGLVAAPGTLLQDLLFEEGVEFPCGGQGACGKCRVRVVSGRLDATGEDISLLGEEAVDAGWRLACRGRITHDATLLLAQWDARVLSDNTPIEVSSRDGWGIAVDLGTTTVAAQLVELAAGNVLSVRVGLNPQVACGADIMSRVHYAVTGGGALRLTTIIRRYVGAIVRELLNEAIQSDHPAKSLREVVVVGNTVMHHLFAGYDVASLARCPFNTPHPAEAVFSAADLEWDLPAPCQVRFLPCLGGFVGSDVLAGVIATGMDRSPGLQVLIDLGTNGEIVVTDGDRMLCAATAAGPAFEGARIRMGMRATHGAIDRVTIAQDRGRGQLQCHVLGGVAPQGVCGSGLIDAASCALELGLLAANGRLTGGSDRLPLAGSVFLHQCDIRELQLAKGAIAAGIMILLDRLHGRIDDVADVYLCGAFGNYLDVEHARRLGLLPFPVTNVRTMGNTALLGAKIALLAGEESQCRMSEVCRRMEHVGIHEEHSFMDVYVRNMPFPMSLRQGKNS